MTTNPWFLNQNPIVSWADVQLSIPKIPQALLMEVLENYRQKESTLLWVVVHFHYAPDQGWRTTVPTQHSDRASVRFMQPIGFPNQDVVLELCVRAPFDAFFSAVDSAGEVPGVFHGVLSKTDQAAPELAIRLRLDPQTAIIVPAATLVEIEEGIVIDKGEELVKAKEAYKAAVELGQKLFLEDPYSVPAGVLYSSLAKQGYYWNNRNWRFEQVAHS